MKPLKLGIIGAGNIVRTRHLPEFKLSKNRYNLVGIVDRDRNRAQDVATAFGIPNYGSAESNQYLDQQWFNELDAVLVATPPLTHASIIDSCLACNKHVIVEKPFVVDIEHGRRILDLAAKKDLVLSVNHNFQFSSSFNKLRSLIACGDLGDIVSILASQFSNDTRRLPSWGDNLPLGLFYDESPHFFYLIQSFCGGELKIRNVDIIPHANKKNTPHIINVNIDANGIPTTVYCNFVSPICEWNFIVFGSRKFAMVDLFRDIITVLPNDGQHLMKEVFTTSWLSTAQHWQGFVRNGFKYIRNRLHYGMDATHRNFYEAIRNNNPAAIASMSGMDGLNVNIHQHTIASSR
jgi:scyllo-inositol 2-dehydrogenase (NADP+)